MSELCDIYESGDRIYVSDHLGRVWVYVAQSNGSVMLISAPEDQP